MLAPIENEYRRLIALDGIWDFCLDAEDRGVEIGFFRQFPDAHRPMPVPASYNDITVEPEIRDHIGPVWYRRRFHVPYFWRESALVVRFGAVSHHATVWLNGVEVADHRGGFLPFEGNLGGAARFGATNELVVRVDNRLDWTTLPPGKLLPAGTKRPGYTGNRLRQDYFHDFFNYAGIHRSVQVQRLPKQRIAAVGVETSLESGTGSVGYEVTLEGSGTVSVTVCDQRDHAVAEGSGALGTLTIPNATPWGPGKPYLYEFIVRLSDDAGVQIDEYRLKIGVRSVSVTPNAFLINGEPFYFKGFGKHEDVEIKGKGHDDAVMLRDFALLEWLGANSFRTSHYPYDEAWLDMADRLGIVVIDEVPAVGMNSWNKNEGWFTEDKLGSRTLEHHLACIRELVARDSHHPCVVMWSVANEASTWEPASRAYFERCIDLFRALDDRPLTLPQSSNPEECQVQDLLDVVSLNRYYGWYENTADLTPDVVKECLAHEIRAWRARFPNQPFMMAEFGADTIAGQHSLPFGMFSEEFQAELVQLTRECLAGFDFVVGEHLWAFADFMTKQGLTRVGGNRKGLFTRQRQPKLAAHELRAAWRRLK
jgi:beta-glucuronidase